MLIGCPDAQPGTPDGGGGSGGGSDGAGAGGPNAGGNGVGGNGAGANGAGGSDGPVPVFSDVDPINLVSTGEDFNDQFGWSVGVSGDTVVIGAYRDWSSLVVGGAVHVYVRSEQGFDEQAVLRPNPPQQNSYFAYSVAISGDVVWSGAPSYSDRAEVAGAAYVMTRNGTSWVSQVMHEQDPPWTYAHFGSAVAVGGDYAVIGAPQTSTGQAFILEKSGNTWSAPIELLPDEDLYDFGLAVAIDGDTAIVGADEAAFVFVRDGEGWHQQAKLIAGNGGPEFGGSVGLSGNIAIVGSSLGEANAAYVFVRNGTEWTQEAELHAEDAANDDSFGQSVAVSGPIAFVGAPKHDAESMDSGAAYVFERSGGTWSQQAMLIEESAGDEGHFGTAVAIDGKLAAVGGVNDSTGRGSVSIYQAE